MDELLWDSKTSRSYLVNIDYEEYLSNDDAFRKLLFGLYSSGLAFIRGAPAKESDSRGIVAETIAKRIGYIKNTFYGSSWNVVADPNAKNIA